MTRVNVAIVGSVFDEASQAAQGLVPLLGDYFYVTLRGFEAAALQSPDTLAAVLYAAH